ncbi:hypothetical protein, partial [Caldibacillus debilis]|uniref:hypothetical protein n=1 Tax=Caldibacillus debilis TaxID=301148 RepID=UPI001F441AF8
KSVYQAKKFGDVDPKIATSQKARRIFSLDKNIKSSIVKYLISSFLFRSIVSLERRVSFVPETFGRKALTLSRLKASDR